MITDLKAQTGYRSYMGGFFKVLIAPETTQGSMALLEMTLPRGVEPPPHMHTKEDESFYLQEGEMTFYIGDKTIRAKPGDAVFAPRMVPHSFEINTESAKFLTLLTPGNFLDYFMEFSRPETGNIQIVPPQGPPPQEFVQKVITSLTGTYGLILL